MQSPEYLPASEKTSLIKTMQILTEQFIHIPRPQVEQGTHAGLLMPLQFGIPRPAGRVNGQRAYVSDVRHQAFVLALRIHTKTAWFTSGQGEEGPAIIFPPAEDFTYLETGPLDETGNLYALLEQTAAQVAASHMQEKKQPEPPRLHVGFGDSRGYIPLYSCTLVQATSNTRRTEDNREVPTVTGYTAAGPLKLAG